MAIHQQVIRTLAASNPGERSALLVRLPGAAFVAIVIMAALLALTRATALATE